MRQGLTSMRTIGEIPTSACILDRFQIITKCMAEPIGWAGPVLRAASRCAPVAVGTFELRTL